MMKLKPRCVNGSSRAMMLRAVVGSVACLGLLPSGHCQTVPNTLLVNYVSPSLLSSSRTTPPTVSTNTAPAAEAKVTRPCNLIKPTAMTSGDRWTVFESEYGIQVASSSAIGRIFQVAKYGLDRMTFSAQQTVKRLEFTYNIANEPSNVASTQAATPQYSLPMFGRFGHAQLKSVVTIHDPQTGQAFIGLKLSIPFGQGG